MSEVLRGDYKTSFPLARGCFPVSDKNGGHFTSSRLGGGFSIMLSQVASISVVFPAPAGVLPG